MLLRGVRCKEDNEGVPADRSAQHMQEMAAHARNVDTDRDGMICAKGGTIARPKAGGGFAGPFWAPKLVNKNLPSTVVDKISLTEFLFHKGARNGIARHAKNRLSLAKA